MERIDEGLIGQKALLYKLCFYDFSVGYHKRLSYTPTPPPSLIKHSRLQAEFFCKLRVGVLFFLTTLYERNVGIITLIAVLFFPCSPAAVFWFVITIVVNSFYAMFVGWSFAHVFQEKLKVVPTLTNFNPSATIVGIISCISRFGTFTPHLTPCFINFIVRPSMSAIQVAYSCFYETTTRLYVTGKKFVSDNFYGIATVAATHVTNFLSTRIKLYWGKFSKLLVNNVRVFTSFHYLSVPQKGGLWKSQIY